VQIESVTQRWKMSESYEYLLEFIAAERKERAENAQSGLEYWSREGLVLGQKRCIFALQFTEANVRFGRFLPSPRGFDG